MTIRCTVFFVLMTVVHYSLCNYSSAPLREREKPAGFPKKGPQNSGLVVKLPFSHTLSGGADADDKCFKPSAGDNGSPRVAVGLFGLSRNLSLTVGTFQRHVFDVLDRGGIRYDIFWSTMVTASFSNARTKESDVKLNIDDYQLLHPCRYTVFNQDNIKHKLFHDYRSHTMHDAWRDGFVCLQNLLCAFHSQMKLWDMIRQHMQEYDVKYEAILALRPDTAIISDIDLPKYLSRIISNPQERVLWIPDFHWYLGYNDRAVFGSAEVVRLYLSRGNFYINASFGFNSSTGPICKKQGQHRNTGECFLKLYLDHFGVTVLPSTMRMLRTRHNGVIPRHDHDLQSLKLGNMQTVADYNRCVSVASGIRDKSQNTFLNPDTC